MTSLDLQDAIQIETDNELLVQVHDEGEGLLIVKASIRDEAELVPFQDGMAVADSVEDVAIEKVLCFVGNGLAKVNPTFC